MDKVDGSGGSGLTQVFSRADVHMAISALESGVQALQELQKASITKEVAVAITEAQTAILWASDLARKCSGDEFILFKGQK